MLAAEGCNVDAPAAQGCCGALALHAGNIDQARELARHNIEVFERVGVDRIVVNAAGCGSSMKEYGELFADDPAWADAGAGVQRPRARRLGGAHGDRRAAGASGIRSRRASCITTRVTSRTRRAFARSRARCWRRFPGIELLSPAEAEICCGSAGIYNLVQPEPAAQLGERKARNIAALTPDVIATGNPGCILQIAAAGTAARIRLEDRSSDRIDRSVNQG